MLLIEEEGESHYFLIRHFDRFMYNQALHRGRNHICLQSSKTPEILGTHVADVLKLFCFEINDKQIIKTPKNVETNKFINYEKDIKPPYMLRLLLYFFLYCGFVKLLLNTLKNMKRKHEKIEVLV